MNIKFAGFRNCKIILLSLLIYVVTINAKAVTLFESMGIDPQFQTPQNQYNAMMAQSDEIWAANSDFMALVKRVAPDNKMWDATILVTKHQFALASNPRRAEFERGLTPPPLPSPPLGNPYLIGRLVLLALTAFGLVAYIRLKSAHQNSEKILIARGNILIGVRGWLLFFLIGLGVLGPAYNIASITRSFHDYEKLFPIVLSSVKWLNYKDTQWFAIGAYSLFCIYAALKMRFFWDKSSLTLAKVAVLLGPAMGLILGIFIPEAFFSDSASRQSADFYIQLVSSCFFTVLWLAYLSKSRRVKATYNATLLPAGFDDDTHTPPDSNTREQSKMTPISMQREQSDATRDSTDKAVHVVVSTVILDDPAAPASLESGNVSSAANVINRTAVDEEKIWGVASHELEVGPRRTGLWAKAFAESDGDETKARVTYLKARVKQLIDAGHDGGR